jgi:uncharacterized protein YdaU (DUF1376 family)
VSNFYKMDPAAWDFGTAELSLEEEAAYLRIVNAIHKHDGPVPNIDRVLAGLFRCSPRKARGLVDALVAAGKVLIEDGKIWNERARSDLFQRQLASGSAAIRGSKGGRNRAINAAKALKDNDTPQANASSRIEENRIEKKETEPNGSGKKKSSPRSRLPEGWKLPRDWGVWAVEKGLSDPAIRHEAEAFANYHRAKGSLMADWQAAWRTWINNQIKFAAERQRPKVGGEDFWAGRALT